MMIVNRARRTSASNEGNRPYDRIPDKVIIYESELEYLSGCILESPQIETGGNVFGLFTPYNIPMIYYVVGPGPGAVHNVAHFRQDFDFLDRNADCLVSEHALHHIGSWHSHHSLGLTQPSGGDNRSTLEGMRECGLQSFLLIIGNCRRGKSSVRPYRYWSDGRCDLLRWVVLPGVSPIRAVYDKAHPEMVHAPRAAASMEELDTCQLVDQQPVAPIRVTYPDGYWLNRPECKTEFKDFVQSLRSQFDNVRIYQKEDGTVELQLVDGARVMLLNFGVEFPASPPTLYAHKGSGVRHDENGVIEVVNKFINRVKLL